MKLYVNVMKLYRFLLLLSPKMTFFAMDQMMQAFHIDLNSETILLVTYLHSALII